MKRWTSIIWLLSFMCLGLPLVAQISDEEALIESVFADQTYDIPYEDLYETYLSLRQNKIALNNASWDDISGLFFLTRTQQYQLWRFVKDYGRVYTWYELMLIEGFDKVLVEKLQFFCTLDVLEEEKFDLAPDEHFIQSRYQREIEERKGYSDGSYVGSADKLYIRYGVRKRGKYSAGITLEKDPGEVISWNTRQRQYGFDFVSWHASWHNLGVVKDIVAGHYTFQSGQGLVFGAGFRRGKGLSTNQHLLKGQSRIQPYRSVYENPAYQGVAVTIKLKGLRATAISSLTRRDAGIEYDSIDDFGSYIENIRNTGLHRTTGELAGRKAIEERMMGTNLEYTLGKSWQLGINAAYTRFDTPFMIDSTKVYKNYSFTGTDNYIGSVYSKFQLKDAIIYGEAAQSKSNGIGLVAGVEMPLTTRIHLNVHYRNLHPEFHSFYGSTMGENVALENEKGLYAGISWQLSRKVQFAGYIDKYNFPWLRFRASSPSAGNDGMVSLQWQIMQHMEMDASVRWKNYQINESEENTTLPNLIGASKQQFRLRLVSRPMPDFTLSTRFQLARYHISNTNDLGSLIYIDARWRYSKFDFGGRVTVFNTDSFETRQYVYERDLPGIYSSPFYQGKGSAYMLMIKCQLLRNADLGVKWSHIRYQDQLTIGSGNDQIDGNSLNHIKLYLALDLR